MSSGSGTGGGDERDQICRQLGIPGLVKAHELIVEGLRRGTHALLTRGLNSARLMQLGYTQEGMRRLGYGDAELSQLGYRIEPGHTAAHRLDAQKPSDAPVEAGNDAAMIRRQIDGGARAADLRQAGWRIDQVKRAGLTASELVRLGYTLSELIGLCTVMELKRADFNARELGKYFQGSELRTAGFSAADMRIAGCGIRDLLRMGYPENQVRTAGYSTNELLREGLSKTTRTL